MSTFILVVAALILVGSSTASIIAPTPVTVVEAAANLSMIKTLSCHDAGCKDCVPVPVVPTGATATDNCVTVGESSTSYWIFSNGTLLMKFYATIDCDGQETVGERYVEEEKCYNNGPHSSVFFYVPPGPAPAMPKPALIKDLKIYDCLGHKCQKDCKLQKFVNATIRANCIMWPEISTSYWVLGKGKMMMNVYTGNVRRALVPQLRRTPSPLMFARLLIPVLKSFTTTALLKPPPMMAMMRSILKLQKQLN